MKQFWNNLSSMQKVFVIVIAIILLWVFWNTLQGYYMTAKNTLQNTGEMAGLQSQGITPTYTAAQYSDMADSLFTAMDGYGTNEDKIYAVFNKLRNDADFIKLDQAFGVRGATDDLFGFYAATDLQGWIIDDLDSSEITKLNNILRKKGISHTFAYSA